jgi:uncharacterized lipoprotein YmbA
VKNRTKIAGLILIALLAGCSSSPKPSFYNLSTEGAPTAVIDAKTSYSVAVGPLTLPDMLNRPQMVVRVDANRVEIDEFHRWAGPLQQDMVRVIAENMAQVLAVPRVLSSSQSGAGDADFRVEVDIQRFDTIPGKGVAIEAAWMVRRSAGGTKSGHVLVEEPAGAEGYDVLVAAHSRALGRISRDIAKDVQALAVANPG